MEKKWKKEGMLHHTWRDGFKNYNRKTNNNNNNNNNNNKINNNNNNYNNNNNNNNNTQRPYRFLWNLT